MKIGDYVIIRRNPHDRSLTDVVGRVRAIQAGMGLGGCDLVRVQYANPLTGERATQPFAIGNIEPATSELLHRLAEQFEKRAASFRRAAKCFHR